MTKKTASSEKLDKLAAMMDTAVVTPPAGSNNLVSAPSPKSRGGNRKAGSPPTDQIAQGDRRSVLFTPQAQRELREIQAFLLLEGNVKSPSGSAIVRVGIQLAAEMIKANPEAFLKSYQNDQDQDRRKAANA